MVRALDREDPGPMIDPVRISVERDDHEHGECSQPVNIRTILRMRRMRVRQKKPDL